MVAVSSLAEEHQVAASTEKNTCINPSQTVTDIRISKCMWVIHVVKLTP
jgi:hypothetical protein